MGTLDWLYYFTLLHTSELGGGKRDRTADLLHAMQALSQLSYTPAVLKCEHYSGRTCISQIATEGGYKPFCTRARTTSRPNSSSTASIAGVCNWPVTRRRSGMAS